MLHGPVRRRWSLEEIVRLVDDRQARARWRDALREDGVEFADDWLRDARLLDPPPAEPDPEARVRAVQLALRAAYVASNGPSGAR